MARAAENEPPRRSSRKPRARGPASSSDAGPASSAERELISQIQRAADPAFSTARGLRGPDVMDQATFPEKEKVSITLDKPLVDEIRAHFGGRALSTSINELLHAAMARERLGALVAEMEQEAGPASPEAYERVLAQWFAKD